MLRERREWAWLALALLLLAAMTLWGHLSRKAETQSEESQRLNGLAAVVELNLTRQLQGAYAAMRGVRDDLVGGPLPAGYANARLRTLQQALPGVRKVDLLDASGQVQASSLLDDVGSDLSGQATFERARALPDATRLYVSEPKRDGSAGFGIDMALMLPGPGRVFSGLIQATFDGDYFQTLLASVRYAPDMRASVSHGDGVLILVDPPDASGPGTNVAREGSPFKAHRDSGAASSINVARAVLGGDVRVVALRTLGAAGLPLERPLVVTVSRKLDDMLAPVRRETSSYLALSVLAAALSVSSLALVQRRRRDALRQEQALQQTEAAQAEFLALALRGGDLGLWNLNLVTLKGVVNDRWQSMLGYVPGQTGAGLQVWKDLIHPDDRDAAIAAQTAHIEGHTPSYEARYRMHHQEGHWVWVLDRGRVVERDADGRALRMAGTHLDVTERVQAEESLRASEESLAVTLHSIGDAVIATDTAGRVTRMNITAERLTGWPAAEGIGQPLSRLFCIFNAQTREPVADPVAKVLASGQIVGLANHTVLVARNGAEHQIADSAAPIRSAGGEVQGVVLVFSDVTERYRAEEALRDRERQLSLISDSLPSPVSRVGRDGHYLFVNAAFGRWFGTQPQQVVGRTQQEVLPPQRLAEIMPHVERARAGHTVTFDDAVVSAEGLRHAIVTLLPDRDEQGLVRGHFTVMTDITERKKSDEALRLSEARLRTATRIARLSSWRADTETGQLLLSPELAQLLDIDPAEPLVLPDGINLISPQERECWRQRLAACLAGGPPFDEDLHATTRDGRAIHLRVLGEAVFDAGGHVIGVEGAAQDVTESRRAQQQLRLLEACVSRLNDVVLITEAEPLDEPGPRIVFANPAFERLTGWRPDEVLGLSPRLLQGPETDRDELARIGAALRAGMAVHAELQNHDKHGRVYWVETEILPVLGADGRPSHMVAVQRDISERKQAEAERHLFESQLREMQKMESIGTLAGGIAHDFNNILAAILGNVSLARDDLQAPQAAGAAPTEHPALESLDQIQKAGLRARSLVQQILTFSRREPQKLNVQPLRPILEETLSLLRATLPAGVQLDSQLANEPLLVEADATQLEQVLMNLCTNAWQAIEGGHGRIEVGLAWATDRPAGMAPGQARVAGPHAHVWVSDTGAGMDASTRERIFDPFFTTKPVGQGTGLGLSVVHGIIDGHGGAIRVDSSPGQGSQFHIYLPLAGLAQAQARPGTAAVAVAGGRGQELLYVDDDEVVGMMMRRLLQRAGYNVTVCSLPREALELVAQQPARFHAVVSDYNMPEMSGLDLAQRLLQLVPELPIVITSGYLSDELYEQASRHGVRALVKKENTLEELAALLHGMLTP